MYEFFEFILIVCIPIWTIATVATKAVQSSIAQADAEPAADVLLEQSNEITSRVDALERALNSSHVREEILQK